MPQEEPNFTQTTAQERSRFPKLNAALLAAGLLLGACTQGSGNDSTIAERSTTTLEAEPIGDRPIPITSEDTLAPLASTTSTTAAEQSNSPQNDPETSQPPHTHNTPEATDQQVDNQEWSIGENLNQAQIQVIIEQTNLPELANHAFTVSGRFSTDGAETIVITMDDAKPPLPTEQMKNYLSAAERIAATNPTFTLDVQLGNNGETYPLTVTGRSNHLQPDARKDQHVVIYSNSDLNSLGSPIPYCNTWHYAYGRDVSLLQVFPQDSEFSTQQNSNLACYGIEAAQLAVGYDLNTESSATATNPNNNTRGLSTEEILTNFAELLNNGYGFAIVAGQEGWTYERYAELARQQKLPERLGQVLADRSYPVLPPETYALLS
jgi:hypothetical protein